MENYTETQAPGPENSFFINPPSFPQKSGISITSYLLIFCFIFCAEKTWTTFRSTKVPLSKSKPTPQFETPVWYPHKDPFLGFDVFLVCAKGIFSYTYLATIARIISRHGTTLSYLFLGRQTVITVDPENLKALLSERFHDFGLGNVRTSSLQPLLGGGIFNSDGSAWKHHRTTLRPFVSRVGPAELAVIETHVQNLIKTIPADGSTIDLQKSFSSFTIDIATDLFLGTSTNLLSLSGPDHPEAQEFAAAFDYAQRAASGADNFRIRTLLWKLVFGDTRLKGCIESIHTFIDVILDRAIVEQEGDMKAQGDKAFLPALLDDGRTREDVKYDILNITLAGKDTMASFLSSIWYVLSQRPDIVDKIREEISGLDGRQPTKEEIGGFKYLHMVLQEGEHPFPHTYHPGIPTIWRRI